MVNLRSYNRKILQEGLLHSRFLSLGRVARALDSVGALARAGLQAVSEIWAAKSFSETEGYDDNRKMVRSLVDRLHAEGLVSSHATQDVIRSIWNYWQLPMYDLDFRELQVPLEDLDALE